MEVCLISKEPMEHEIRLPCNHAFDYIYLYHELVEQKRLQPKGFNCPYCREPYETTIPYYEIEGVGKKIKINYSTRTMPLLHCLLCSEPAHQFKHGVYCIKHSKLKKFCLGVCKNGESCKNTTLELYCRIHKII